MPSNIPVTGIILAGGEGRRMGGVDKGWVHYQGTPLIQHVIKAISPQVDNLIISANRNLKQYQQLGYPVFEDNTPYLGPLGGIAAALSHIQTEYGLIVPTDAPHIPVNLVDQLIEKQPAKLILCQDNERLQPLFGLYHRSLVKSIQNFLNQGQRKLTRWCLNQTPETVLFENNRCFTNLNSLADLENPTKQ